MSRNNQRIIYAYHVLGYRVSKEGVLNKATRLEHRGYLVHTIGVRYINETERGPLYVHKLQAYQKYGAKAFAKGVVVRHLDGDPTNNCWDNIAIGSISDNAMDRDPLVRKNHAYHAAWCETSSMKGQYLQVKADREAGMSYNQLKKKYGIPKSTLSRYFGNSKTPISKDFLQKHLRNETL